MLTVARKERLLEAFRAAGARGMTSAEMAGVVGEWWRLRLTELRDEGYVFLEHESTRRPGTTFRWVLVTEPAHAVDTESQPTLFTPAPDSAIGGE